MIDFIKMIRIDLNIVKWVVLAFCIGCSNEGTGDSIVIVPDPLTINVRQLSFPSPKYIMVAAHRGGGYKGVAPENSINAINNSLALGVDIIEIDVRITIDGELVVIHDKTLERTTTGSGKVSHHTLQEIKAFYLKDENGVITNERVPTLEEVMIAVGNKALVFIDKSELVIQYVRSVLNKTNSSKQALFMDFIEVKDVKSRYGNLLNTAFFIPATHKSISNLDTYYSDFNDVFKPNPSAFAFWFEEENSKSFSLISKTKKDGIPVWVNTTTVTQSAGHTDEVSLSDPDSGWGWVIDQGANILFTDYPEALIDYLNGKDLR